MRSSPLVRQERHIVVAFLAVPLVLMLLFGLWPLLNLIYLSFTDWNGISQTKTWVGWANYQKVLHEPVYWQALRANAFYLGSGLLQIVLAMYFATLLSFKTYASAFFKASFVLPLLISSVAVGMMFRLFFSSGGTLDQILIHLGLSSWVGYWLGDPERVNLTLAFISLWRNLGRSFLMYFGAIQSIPTEHFKLAEIEGATFGQKVRWVILPQVTTVLKLDFILLTIGVVSVFDLPFIMLNGSNGSGTILVKTVKLAFENKKFGLAASLSVLITLIIVILSLLQQRLRKREVANG